MAQKFNDTCGPTNALQTLAQAYGQSNARLRSGVERQVDALMPGGSKGDVMAQEYLAAVGQSTAMPTTFNVHQLLGQSTSKQQADHWAAEFAQHRPPQRAASDKWAQEFAGRFDMRNMRQELNQMGSSASTKWADEFAGQQLAQLPAPQHEQWSREFDDWLAGRQGQEPSQLSATFDQAWQDALPNENKEMPMSERWAEEFAQLQQTSKDPDNILEQEFESIFQRGMDAYNNYDAMEEIGQDYQFQETNPHREADGDLISAAQEQFRAGHTNEAILFYEAAVQRDPTNASAWCQLGLLHAENEHDIAAISAFRKCLELDDKNGEALLGYAVSLANENFGSEALSRLEQWIRVYRNEQGTSIPINSENQHKQTIFPGYIEPARFAQVEDQFLKAARAQTQAVDPELQNALSVLYNLNGTFDRAVDSIKAAIASRPEDARLWNRLGATLANGNQTAEAVDAYRQALRLFPAYVRARSNLGISCMHLNCYREAAEHFLNALQLQKGPEDSPIWSTLRTAIFRLQATDPQIMSALDNRDLVQLSRALQAMDAHVMGSNMDPTEQYSNK